jgi:hypothetical protein
MMAMKHPCLLMNAQSSGGWPLHGKRNVSITRTRPMNVIIISMDMMVSNVDSPISSPLVAC